MTNSWYKPLVVLVCSIAVVAFVFRQYFAWRWTQNRVDLTGTIQAGMQMQLVAEDFNKRMNRYPTGKELTGLLQNICAYNEGVSPYQTDKIVSTFDNSGGWLYDRTSGAVKINYNGKYPIGFRSWVDVSKVNFYIPVKVDAISHGKFETLDFSSLSNWLNSEQPEIQKIITNWATTNVVKTGSKNIVGLDASAQN